MCVCVCVCDIGNRKEVLQHLIGETCRKAAAWKTHAKIGG